MVEVEIQQGRLEGEVLESSSGDGKYYSFKGIPYGAPPVGTERFKAPKPAPGWSGVKQAKQHGPSCPQKEYPTNVYQPGSENCLYLNVYTPELTPTSPLPVVFFIHGGGFRIGNGDVDRYGPDYLVTKGVILVTVNYRFEILGFLCLDTKDVPGNAGLKDQVLALKWVKNNIEKFGGDPNNVTLFGESAGAVCAGFHILSPMSKGLFNRTILQSGNPLVEWALCFEPKRRAFQLGKELGLQTNDPQELLEFLQNTSPEKLINSSPYVHAAEEKTNFFLKMVPFSPVVEKDFGEEQFLIENPIDILRSGNFNHVDIIIGNTSHEMLSGISITVDKIMPFYNQCHEIFVPRDIYYGSKLLKILDIGDRIKERFFGQNPISVKTLREFLQCVNGLNFNLSINRFLTILSKIGKCKIYRYIFSARTNRNIHGKQGKPYGISGPGHGDDTMHLFDPKKFRLTRNKGSREYEVSELMCTLFTNYAKYRVPDGENWPEFDTESKKYADISSLLIVRDNFEAANDSFWESIYDDTGIDYY